MKWALIIVIFLLSAGCAKGELKPHQRDAVERIQKRFNPPPLERPVEPPAPIVRPVAVPDPPKPKAETLKPKIKPKPIVKPKPEPKPEPKPRPKQVQVQVSPAYCAQIAMGVKFFGVAGMKQKARERGYSSGQIAAAMRACGYS